MLTIASLNNLFIFYHVVFSMNTHALLSSHLRDELINCSNICGADHEDYLRALPEKDQKLIDTLRKKITKGEEPWHPLTRRYLARLLFDVSGILLCQIVL